jgi:hypothetical protein
MNRPYFIETSRAVAIHAHCDTSRRSIDDAVGVRTLRSTSLDARNDAREYTFR